MNGTAECCALLARLQQDHREIQRAIIEIRSELSQLDAGDGMRDLLSNIAQRLHSLASDLGRHFASEENGGCFAEVLARCQSLTPKVHAMQGEHPALLRSVEALAASAAEQKCNAEMLLRDFEEFADRLKSHGATENRLLLMALGGDAAEHDEEGIE